MYLESRLKEDAESLYDREEEQSKLASYVKQKSPLILITGFRRVGKTSLLKTVLKAHSEYNILIDLRDLASQTYITKKDIAYLFQGAIQSFLDKHQSKKDKLTLLLRSVKGITFPLGGGIEFDFSEQYKVNLPELFRTLDQWAEENEDDTRIVIAIDEAQEFRKSKHIDMTKIFASLYDNCRNIVLILTGSEVGVLYDFLSLEDASSPLFGRSRKEIKIKPLTHEQSIEFLKIGLEQQGVKEFDTSVLSYAAYELGGIVGWLNEFGVTCLEHGKVSKRYVESTKKTGSVLARSEFSEFLNGRTAANKYELIMKNLSIEPRVWTELKKALELDTDSKIYDANFSSLLSVLVKSGFIQESGKAYSIVDPLLKHSFKTTSSGTSN